MKLDFIQINNLAKLHNADNIWFCKTDSIRVDFNKIKRLNKDIIFITGNSDLPVTDRLVDIAPKNIKKWFCQNALSKNIIIEPIPIGIENDEECMRSGHGYGWGQKVKDKMNMINAMTTSISILEPEVVDNIIYANFNIHTNLFHRNKVKSLSKSKIKHITWHEPTLTTVEWIYQLQKHKMNLCPTGNGIDTHRLWETLYLGRVPITIKIGNYKIYELYKKLPIIVLEDAQELRDIDHIEKLYKETINKSYRLEMLSQSYWSKKILQERDNIKFFLD